MSHKKRWSKRPHNPKPSKPQPLEDKFAHYAGESFSHPVTPAQRRRLRKAANAAFGRAQGLRGAVKSAAMRKLSSLPVAGLVSEDTQRVINDPKWDKKPAKKTTVKEGNTDEASTASRNS